MMHKHSRIEVLADYGKECLVEGLYLADSTTAATRKMAKITR